MKSRKPIFILAMMVGCLLLTGASAFAVDLDIWVKTLNPTSLVEVSYYVGSAVTPTTTVDGSDATTAVNLFAANQDAGSKRLETSYGTILFSLAELGDITITSDPSDGPEIAPATADGNTITVHNTISYPDGVVIRLANNTSVSEIKYYLAAKEVVYSLADGPKSIPSSQVQTGITFDFQGMGENQNFQAVGTFGQVHFQLDSDGKIIITSDPTANPAFAPATVDDSTHAITIQNTISFSSGLAVKAVNNTSIVEVAYELRARRWGPQVDETKTTPGSEAQTEIIFPFQGMAENQLFQLQSEFGEVHFRLDGDGNIIITSDPSAKTWAVHAEVDDLTHTITIQNTISFPDGLAIKVANNTSATEMAHWFRLIGYRWTLVDEAQFTPGSEAQSGVTFAFQGMAENQEFLVYGTFGRVTFRLDSVGNMGLTSDPSTSHQVMPVLVDDSTHTITIQNTISFSGGLAVKAANNTSVPEVAYRLYIREAGPRQPLDETKTTPGSEAQTSVTFPFQGMAENQDFQVQGTFGEVYFRLDAAGNMTLTSDPSTKPQDVPAEVDDSTHTITIQNTLDRRLKVTAESDSTVDEVTYDLWSREYFPVRLELKNLPGSQVQAGTEFQMTGTAPNQDFNLETYFNGRKDAPFRFALDGHPLFLDPAAQLSDTMGSLAIEGGNTLYLEILPANEPPVVSVGDNFEILSEDQDSTVIDGTATDPDEDSLHCRWLEGQTVLVDVDMTGSTCSLDLGDLGPLSLDAHTFTIEVTDGIVFVTDEVVVTVENTPPAVAPSGGGAYEYGAEVTLSGEVSDYDGDDLTYEWRLGEEVPFEGTVVDPPFGGNPVSLPEHALDTTDLDLGDYVIELAVSDASAEIVMPVYITVQDTTDPTLAPVVSRAILWPPNHRMVEVTIEANASDSTGGTVSLAVEVNSSELQEFDGDGNFIPDYEVLDVNSETGVIRLNLRSERSGKGDGRTYTITITGTDGSDNSSEAIVTVVAPHDKKK